METPKRRWSLGKKVLVALVAFVLVIAAIPLWAPGIVLSRALSGVNEKLNGVVTAKSLSFTWGGHVTLTGVEVKDSSGNTKARIATVTADVDVPSAIKGAVRAKVDIESPEILASVGKTAVVDLMELLKAEPMGAAVTQTSAPATAQSTASRPAAVPDFDVTVRRGKVVWTDRLGATTAIDAFDATLASGKNGGATNGKASFRLGGATWTLEGDLTPGPNGPRGKMRFDIPRTELQSVAAVVGSFSGLTRIQGVIEGKGNISLSQPMSFLGDGSLGLTGVEIDGPLVGGRPMKLPTLTLSYSGESDPLGAGKALITFDIKDTLAAKVEARTALQGADTSFVTSYSAEGEVASILATAAGLLGTKDGVQASGKVRVVGSVKGTVTSGALAQTAWTANLLGSGLEVRTPGGKRLNGLANLSAMIDGSHDGDIVTLTKGEIQVASCRASVVGAFDLKKGSFRDGKVTADGDLDALSAELRQIAVLPADFAGKFKLDADITATEKASIRATVTTRGLRVTQQGKSFGPLDLDVTAEGAVTLGAALAADISKWSVRGGGAELEGGLTLRGTSAQLRVKGSVKPMTAGRAFGLLQSADRIDDSPVIIDVDMGVETALGRERVDFRPSQITFRHGSITAKGGINGAQLDGASMEIAATADIAGIFADLGTLVTTGNERPTGRLAATIKATGVSGRADVTAGVEIADLDVTLPSVSGAKPSHVKEPRFRMSVTGSWDPASRRLAIPQFAVSGAGAEINGTADWSEKSAQVAVRGKLRPAPLLAMTGSLPEGFAFDSDIDFDVGGELRGEATAFKGRIGAQNLVIAMPMNTKGQGRVVKDKNVQITFDGSGTFAAGRQRIDLTSLRVDSTHVKLDAKGRVPMSVTDLADFDVTANADLKPMLEQLGLGDLGGATTQGRASLVLGVRGASGLTKLTGRVSVKDFTVAVPEAEGRKAITVTDPSVDLVFDASVIEMSNDLLLNDISLKSTFMDAAVRGAIVGLPSQPAFKGVTLSADYEPTRLGVVLAAFADVAVTGTGKRHVSAALDGPVQSTDFVGLLRAGTGTTSIALAPIQMGSLTLDGTMKSTWTKGTLDTTGDLKFNGGPLAISSSLGLAPGAKGSSLKAALTGAQATGQLSPLASMVNPIFAVTGGAGSTLTGLIDANLDLTVSGQLTEADLTGGWEKFPKDRIDGTGRLGFSQGAVQGSTMLLKLADLLLGTGASEVSLQPITFTIRQGRLSYDSPLRMSVKGLDLVWTGSVGLDRTLALDLEIPVTDALRARLPFLSKLRVDTLRLPVKGTTSNPDVNVGGLLADLAKQALLGEVTGGNSGGGILGGILGGIDKKKPPAPNPAPKSAPPSPTPAPSGSNPSIPPTPSPQPPVKDAPGTLPTPVPTPRVIAPPPSPTPEPAQPAKRPRSFPIPIPKLPGTEPPPSPAPIPTSAPSSPRPVSRPAVIPEPESKPAPKKRRGLFGGG